MILEQRGKCGIKLRRSDLCGPRDTFHRSDFQTLPVWAHSACRTTTTWMNEATRLAEEAANASCGSQSQGSHSTYLRTPDTLPGRAQTQHLITLSNTISNWGSLCSWETCCSRAVFPLRSETKTWSRHGRGQLPLHHPDEQRLQGLHSGGWVWFFSLSFTFYCLVPLARLWALISPGLIKTMKSSICADQTSCQVMTLFIKTVFLKVKFKVLRNVFLQKCQT